MYLERRNLLGRKSLHGLPRAAVRGVRREFAARKFRDLPGKNEPEPNALFTTQYRHGWGIDGV